MLTLYSPNAYFKFKTIYEPNPNANIYSYVCQYTLHKHHNSTHEWIQLNIFKKFLVTNIHHNYQGQKVRKQKRFFIIIIVTNEKFFFQNLFFLNASKSFIILFSAYIISENFPNRDFFPLSIKTNTSYHECKNHISVKLRQEGHFRF